MSVKLRKKQLKGKKSFYLDIYHNGQRKYEFLKLYIIDKPKTPEIRNQNKENIKLAENISAKRQIELSNSQYNFNTVFKQKTDFFIFANNYIEKYKGKSAKLYYKGVIKHFKIFLNKETIKIGEIDSNLIESFKQYLVNSTELSYSTPHSYFARLKTIFKQAVKNEIIIRNPTINISNPKKTTKQTIYLTISEIQILANTKCKNNDVKKAFLFACNTGLRHIDIKNLTWNKIHEKEINNKKSLFVEINQQKTKEPIQIKLNETAKKLIGEKKEPEKFVFNIYNSVGHTNIHLKKWCKDSKINKDLTFHVARHSFATNLLIHKDKTGADLQTVSKLLGHKNLKHTQIYAKIVDSLMNKAVENLPEINIDIEK